MWNSAVNDWALSLEKPNTKSIKGDIMVESKAQEFSEYKTVGDLENIQPMRMGLLSLQ